MGQNVPVDERSFFQVGCIVGVRAEPVSPEQWELEAQSLLADDPLHEEPLHPDLVRWLERLESKLDRALQGMGLEADSLVARAEPRGATLSGSGIRFDGREPFVDGDAVVLELVLDTDHYHPIRILGRVRGPSGSDDDGRIEVQFERIREHDRDRIIEYTLEMERRRIRQRTQGGAA